MGNKTRILSIPISVKYFSGGRRHYMKEIEREWKEGRQGEEEGRKEEKSLLVGCF